MSLLGEHWASKIRGLTCCERNVAWRLGHYHHGETGECFPSRDLIARDLEITLSYVSQTFASLQTKAYILRDVGYKGQRRDGKSGGRRSNDFSLSFTRWFPFADDDVEREQNRLLELFRKAITDPALRKGFDSCWIEEPFIPDADGNRFRVKGRRTYKKQPIGKRLWLAVSSESHLEHYFKIRDQVLDKIEKTTGHRYDCEYLDIWIKSGVKK